MLNIWKKISKKYLFLLGGGISIGLISLIVVFTKKHKIEQKTLSKEDKLNDLINSLKDRDLGEQFNDLSKEKIIDLIKSKFIDQNMPEGLKIEISNWVGLKKDTKSLTIKLSLGNGISQEIYFAIKVKLTNKTILNNFVNSIEKNLGIFQDHQNLKDSIKRKLNELKPKLEDLTIELFDKTTLKTTLDEEHTFKVIFKLGNDTKIVSFKYKIVKSQQTLDQEALNKFIGTLEPDQSLGIFDDIQDWEAVKKSIQDLQNQPDGLKFTIETKAWIKEPKTYDLKVVFSLGEAQTPREFTFKYKIKISNVIILNNFVNSIEKNLGIFQDYQNLEDSIKRKLNELKPKLEDLTIELFDKTTLKTTLGEEHNFKVVFKLGNDTKIVSFKYKIVKSQQTLDQEALNKFIGTLEPGQSLGIFDDIKSWTDVKNSINNLAKKPKGLEIKLETQDWIKTPGDYSVKVTFSLGEAQNPREFTFKYEIKISNVTTLKNKINDLKKIIGDELDLGTFLKKDKFKSIKDKLIEKINDERFSIHYIYDGHNDEKEIDAKIEEKHEFHFIINFKDENEKIICHYKVDENENIKYIKKIIKENFGSNNEVDEKFKANEKRTSWWKPNTYHLKAKIVIDYIRNKINNVFDIKLIEILCKMCAVWGRGDLTSEDYDLWNEEWQMILKISYKQETLNFKFKFIVTK